MNFPEIKKLFDKFGAPLGREDVWSVQSATVIKHKALERLAACARIAFDKPTVLRAERDEAVILVHGSMCAADNKVSGDTRHEWSIGEALVNVNYRVTGKMAAYVYAMAEKRAKDRVILKLAGLQGLYSEDEADEFKEQSSAPPQGRSAGGGNVAASPPASLSSAGLTYERAMRLCATKDALGAWMNDNLEAMKREIGEAEAGHIRGTALALYRDLPEGPSAEAA